MIRLVKMGGKWYGLEIEAVEDDLDNIQGFVDTGDPVMIVGGLSDLERNGLLVGEDIEMVD